MKSIIAFALCMMFGLVGFAQSFQSGYSSKDANYFMESPYVEVHQGAYSLRWKYGKLGFFFEPSSKVENGQLLFSLRGTSSTGRLTGQVGEVPITDPKQIEAVKAGGAFWIEPDGSKVRLQVRNR